MPRDYRKLRVFELADALAIALYEATRAFPSDEKLGLTSQIRRAAVSVAANTVEGCFRESERDYVHFLEIALASCAEAGYLLDVSIRLGYLVAPDAARLREKHDHCIRSLVALVSARRRTLASPNAEGRTPKAAG